MTQSTEDLLAQRKTTHGEYSEHARCTQAIMGALQRERGWDGLPDIVKESLHMFAHKMGRVVTGNWTVKDHYDDIAGYAVLVSQRLEDGVGLAEGHRPVDLPGGRGAGAVLGERRVTYRTATPEEVHTIIERLSQQMGQNVDRGTEAEQGNRRENIGHPGELSSRFLTATDLGRRAVRRDGEECKILAHKFDNKIEVADITVERADGRTYQVGRNGFLTSADTPNAADIRQVILG